MAECVWGRFLLSLLVDHVLRNLFMGLSDRALRSTLWNIMGRNKRLSKLILGDYKEFRNTKFLLAQRKLIVCANKDSVLRCMCTWQPMANTLWSVCWVYLYWRGGCLRGENGPLLKIWERLIISLLTINAASHSVWDKTKNKVK